MNDMMTIPQRPAVQGGMDPIARAEIDIQIATARTYPRSMTHVMRNIMTLVTITKETA